MLTWMVKPRLLTDVNVDKVELEAYGATHHLSRQSEAERIDWNTRHRSWTMINTLPANGVHGGSLRYAVSHLRGGGMMVTSDLWRVGLRVKHRRTRLRYTYIAGETD